MNAACKKSSSLGSLFYGSRKQRGFLNPDETDAAGAQTSPVLPSISPPRPISESRHPLVVVISAYLLNRGQGCPGFGGC
jgi:hypothetical protein